jgi:hypothetical protein
VKYVLLICGDERAINNPQVTNRTEAWGQYSQELAAAGKVLGGQRLRPSTSATTLRLNGGHRLVSDGPFAETKEQLGGFYLIEADNLDEAVDWASKMPHLEDGGSVEIRPIWET